MQSRYSDGNSVCTSVRLSVRPSVCQTRALWQNGRKLSPYLATRELSVRPPVYPSVKRVHCDKTEERSVQIFIPYERSFSLVFWEEERLMGRPLLPEILGQADPAGAKSPIFALFSPVAPQP